MPLFSAFIFLLHFSPGYLLTTFIDVEKKLTRAEHFISIVILGPTVTCYFTLLTLLLTGSWNFSIKIICAFLILTLLLNLSRYKSLNNIKLSNLLNSDYSFPKSIGFWLFISLFCLYALILCGGFLLDNQGYPSIIIEGWGDTAYHLSMVGKLRTADPFILENPILSGTKLTYPFMINLLTALYQRIGFSLFSAWQIANGIYGFSFICLIYMFGRRFLKSSMLSSVFTALVFIGGGIGFFLYFSDLGNAWSIGGADLFFKTIYKPPHIYTHLPGGNYNKLTEFGLFYNIQWIVPAISFLSHQRSFLPGAALTALLLVGVYQYRGKSYIWRWAILWGMIPLFHTHSFIASSIILACWFFLDLKNYRYWILGFIAGCMIALPQVLYLKPADFSSEFSFLKPWFGWVMCNHQQNWYRCDPGNSGVDSSIWWFWTKNFGAVFWFWLGAIVLYFLNLLKRNKENINNINYIIIPGILLFIIPNLFLFQPWSFDNNKLLFYWWIFGSIAAILLIKKLYNKRIIYIIIISAFLIISTLSGMIDILSRLANTSTNHYGYYNRDDVKVADWIKNNTIPNASILTGDFADQYVPMLTGRSIYLGYGGWLWTQGNNKLVSERKLIANNFLTTGDSTALCSQQVGYVVLDHRLLSTYPEINKKLVLKSSDMLFNHNDRQVLKIKCDL